ncbi:MAG: HDOD domain-containing protein, partial [Myxococcota bacterium]
MDSTADFSILTSRDVDAQVLRLVGSPKLAIPPAPTVALKLQALMAKDDFGGPELVQVLESDAALTAMVLRYANAADRAGVVEVTELPAAVSRVGIRAIARLALAQELGRVYGKPGRLGTVRNTLWQRALVSGLVCHTLARHRGWNAEEAFTAGLLHDFGAAVVLAAAETIVHKTDIQRPARRWIQMAMDSHLEVGRIVSLEWNLPSILGDAMVHHHSPGVSESHRELLELIEVSDRVSFLF